MKNVRQGIPVSNSSRTESVLPILEAIKAEFEVVMGSPERVRAACFQLRKQLGKPPTPSDLEHLVQLLPLLGKRMGIIATALFDLFDEITLITDNPWPLLQGMLAAKEKKLVRRALNRALSLAESGSLSIDLNIAKFFANRIEEDRGPLKEPECLSIVTKIINRLSSPLPSGQENHLEAFYIQEKDFKLRSLAARIMDLKGEPVSHDLAEKIIGKDALQFLAPYLDYTRATHLDLLYLVAVYGKPPPCILALQKAEAICGRQLLQEVIAEFGWGHVNLGLEVHIYVSVKIGNSFPLMMAPSEALLFDFIKDFRRSGESYLFVAHGGRYAEGLDEATCEDPVARFRSYNLTHSYLLSDLISVSPLTREKILRIVDWMDKVVFDFTTLFSPYAEDCSILPDVYTQLRERIISELEKSGQEPYLSPELNRLVQTFEDPKSLSEVRTLHGLKRYLHQRGLHLGFRLVETGRATNRTVSLAVSSPKKILRVARYINYTDFDQEAEAASLTLIPYPVSIVVDGYARPILHGQDSLPDVKVFCYGNEVHYYLSFRNHPAFLRIDFSPPLQGGMIDLQYYGVSKYDIDAHPNPSLDAIQEFFRSLEYDIKVIDTHVHARYDKERALDLGMLCEKAEALFRLVPYFMEIDWAIGSLNLNAEARKAVTEAWAHFLITWGVLPLKQLLTRDRQGILMKIERGPAGDREIAWSGQRPYCDTFTSSFPVDLFGKLRLLFSQIGLDTIHLPKRYATQNLGQIPIENLLLKPLRRAVRIGQIIETPGGFHRAPQEFFQRESEAERFAHILASHEEDIVSSAAVARLVRPLDQALHFQTTGSVNGYDVQRALFPICGENLSIYVLRDFEDIIRLALFTQGDILCLRREVPSLCWQSNGCVDAFELARLLRRNNYAVPDLAPVSKEDIDKREDIQALFDHTNPAARPKSFPDERILKGQKVSPGRAVATVFFGTEGRSPEDFEGKLLVAPCVRPEDYPFLYHSAGIVSTGGGILSHAGLTAMQLRKPALIIQGQWQRSLDDKLFFLYRTVAYREESKEVLGYHVTIRFDMHEHEHILREGDLVVLDSDEGVLRILGQDREALAFHENFHHFCEASRRLSESEDKKKILILRGRRLRALHQIEKILSRLTDSVLARHAVHELLMTEYLSFTAGSREEKFQLLSILLNNPSVSKTSYDLLLKIFNDLRFRHNRLVEEAFHATQSSNDLYEILYLRLQILSLRHTIEGVFTTLKGCVFDSVSMEAMMNSNIDLLVRRRLEIMRDALAQKVYKANASVLGQFGLRHLVRQIERLDSLLETAPELRTPIERIKTRMVQREEINQGLLESRRVLDSEDGGFELFPFIGWKAANLAEIERLLGKDTVPQWYAVTHCAFQEIMGKPLEKTIDHKDETFTKSLREAINMILSRHDLDNIHKSHQIRRLWDDIALPPELVDDVLASYHRMNERLTNGTKQGEDILEAFVAIRSSALEEDTETAARAGEFDTFLFIQGERALLEHLKKAWSGLWTERAIHNRQILGVGLEEPGGGVIIQRIARSRTSGVLQTVNIADGNFREMVINAGWGLGEGIVSGTVAADMITVAKQSIKENTPLRFRYITGDKQEHLVFDERTGLGTVRAKTLYHQRLRPSLEYTELCDLARTAAKLEAAYGYPLDIEFCIEGTKLWLLQVRPVATFMATLQETLQRYPLAKQGNPNSYNN